MKTIIRDKMKPIWVEKGDTISLKCDDGYEEITVLKGDVGKAMLLDEAVIFSVEPGDFENAKDGIGGAFLVSGEA